MNAIATCTWLFAHQCRPGARARRPCLPAACSIQTASATRTAESNVECFACQQAVLGGTHGDYGCCNTASAAACM